MAVAGEAKRNHIFISYSERNKQFAAKIAFNLDLEGYDAWMADRNLAGGDEWVRRVEERVLSCDAFIAIVSSASLGSKWVERETLLALKKEKPVFPILWGKEKVETPLHLKGLHRINFRTNQDAALQQLYRALKLRLSPLPAEETALLNQSIVMEETGPLNPPISPAYQKPLMGGDLRRGRSKPYLLLVMSYIEAEELLLVPIAEGEEILIGRRGKEKKAYDRMFGFIDVTTMGHAYSYTVSRVHARIVNDGQNLYVIDSNSTNGTYLNDNRIEAERAIPLKSNDLLRFGGLAEARISIRTVQ